MSHTDPLTPRFVQIHTLHSYPAALLNRDDAGLAKRLPYGGTIRTRVSSQCLKRHWRTADDRYALSRLGVPMAERSRFFIGAVVLPALQARGVPAERAEALAEGLQAHLFQSSDKPKKAANDHRERFQTGQAVLLGKAEVSYLVERCAQLAGQDVSTKELGKAVKEMLAAEKANIAAMKHGSGLESALFGRMVTSDVLATRDASIYVAHAFTVHEAEVENDYFTVVDDLKKDAGEVASAGIFDTELSSGLYYGYVVIDVPQLVANLEGVDIGACFAVEPAQRALAADVTRNLLHLIATVSPGAKRGSTAPFGWAQTMLVEAGDAQPRSLATAFQQALPLQPRDDDAPLAARATRALLDAMRAFDDAYGMPQARRITSVTDGIAASGGIERLALAKLADWAADCIRAGACA